MKDALDTTWEITRLIKYSPCRDAIFQHLKETLPTGSTLGIRVLCMSDKVDRTCWINPQYLDELQNPREDMGQSHNSNTWYRDQSPHTRCSDIDANIWVLLWILVSAFIMTMDQNRSNHSSMRIELRVVTVIAATSWLSAADMTTCWSVRLRCLRMNLAIGVKGPQLYRCRKLPQRFDEGLSSGDYAATPKAHFKRCYFEAVDLIVNCIKDWFDQPGYRTYHLLETLLLKACKQEELEENNLAAVC